jgi:hypothetical protein
MDGLLKNTGSSMLSKLDDWLIAANAHVSHHDAAFGHDGLKPCAFEARFLMSIVWTIRSFRIFLIPQNSVTAYSGLLIQGFFGYILRDVFESQCYHGWVWDEQTMYKVRGFRSMFTNSSRLISPSTYEHPRAN